MDARFSTTDNEFVIEKYENSAMSTAIPQTTDRLTPHFGKPKAEEPMRRAGSTEKNLGSNDNQCSPSDTIPLLSAKQRGVPTEQKSELGTRNAEYQEIWEEVMEGVGTTGAPHKKTAVLMISWDKSLDDLDTAGEVDELGDVFEKKFRYTVVKKQLTADKPPVNQLRKHISDFIYEHDSPFTLLILYYAGHGTEGKPGELHFTASGIPQHKQSARNSVPWLRLEPSFDDVEGDILLIFDCCHAGSLVSHLETPRGYWPTKSFEFFAACRGDSLTHPPGPKSFTRALIYALEELLKTRKKFTTHELQTAVGRAPNFPKDQHAQVLDRGHPCDQRLVLAPIPLATGNENMGSTNQDASTTRSKEYFDLRFWYVKRPDVAEIREVARIMKKLIVEEKIRANRIAWIQFSDMNSIETVRKCVEKWKLRSKRLPTAESSDSKLDASQVYKQGRSRSPSPSIPREIGHEDDLSEQIITLKSPELGETQSVTVSGNGNMIGKSVLVVTSRSNFVRITQFANVAILRDTRLKHPGALLFVVVVLLSISLSHRLFLGWVSNSFITCLNIRGSFR